MEWMGFFPFHSSDTWKGIHELIAYAVEMRFPWLQCCKSKALCSTTDCYSGSSIMAQKQKNLAQYNLIRKSI